MNQQQRRLKQTYLRQQILQHNYDPEEFIIFLNNQLHIDCDIDKCTFEELKEIVKLFVTEKQNIIIEDIGKTSLENSSRVQQFKGSPIIFKKYQIPVVEDEFEKQHSCIKINQKYSHQLTKKIKITVQNAERKYSGGVLGIGATSFLEFQVKTSELNWVVGRRYSDFFWLRQILKKNYPTQIIPPIPAKKAAKRTKRHIDKRMQILQYFLNDIIKIPEILNSKFVEIFLACKQSNQFQTFKKQSQNKQIYESISSTETVDGLIRVGITKDKVAYVEKLTKFTQKSQVIFKQATREGKKFHTLQIDQINCLYELGNKFAELYEISRDFESEKQSGIGTLAQAFIKLNNMTIEWGNSLKAQISLLETNFTIFLKYIRQSLMGVRQVLENCSKQQQVYLQTRGLLDKKKQKIFLLHDVSKWQLPKKELSFLPKAAIHDRTEAFRLMLPKESVEAEKLMNNYAYYLSRTYENSQKYFQRTADLFYTNFKLFSIRNKVSNQQLGQMWNDMSSVFSNANISHILKQKSFIQTTCERPEKN